MGVHEFALLDHYGQADLFEGPLCEGFALLSFEAYKGYIIACTGQRGTDAYHALVVVEVISNGAYNFFNSHLSDVKIRDDDKIVNQGENTYFYCPKLII